jgi:hypothetical protein
VQGSPIVKAGTNARSRAPSECISVSDLPDPPSPESPTRPSPLLTEEDLERLETAFRKALVASRQEPPWWLSMFVVAALAGLAIGGIAFLLWRPPSAFSYESPVIEAPGSFTVSGMREKPTISATGQVRTLAVDELGAGTNLEIALPIASCRDLTPVEGGRRPNCRKDVMRVALPLVVRWPGTSGAEMCANFAVASGRFEVGAVNSRTTGQVRFAFNGIGRAPRTRAPVLDLCDQDLGASASAVCFTQRAAEDQSGNVTVVIEQQGTQRAYRVANDANAAGRCQSDLKLAPIPNIAGQATLVGEMDGSLRLRARGDSGNLGLGRALVHMASNSGTLRPGDSVQVDGGSPLCEEVNLGAGSNLPRAPSCGLPKLAPGSQFLAWSTHVAHVTGPSGNLDPRNFERHRDLALLVGGAYLTFALSLLPALGLSLLHSFARLVRGGSST